MLPRVAAIIRREYLERVRTKAFWISTLLVPLLMGAAVLLPALLAARGGGTYTVAVLDLTGRYFGDSCFESAAPVDVSGNGN